MRPIFIPVLAASFLAVSPLSAQQPIYDVVHFDARSSTGLVVIGVAVDGSSDFTWRRFDPATGRLQPFENGGAGNVTKNAKTAVAGLFSALGHLGRSVGGDKRLEPNAAGVSYRLAELPPGDYVAETIIANGRQSVLEGDVPIVRIRAGRIAYVGDYSSTIDRKDGGRVSPVGRSVSGASAFLRQFRKIEGTPDDDRSGTALLDCKPKRVPFANRLLCSEDRSRVTGIAAAGASAR